MYQKMSWRPYESKQVEPNYALYVALDLYELAENKGLYWICAHEFYR